jgi:cation diffusion facilitator family transporter
MSVKISCGTRDLSTGCGPAMAGTIAGKGRPLASDSGTQAARFALGSLALAVLVLALKAVAAWLTGSIALSADALESVVNVVTAIAALVAVRLAARPADASLPYGYGKAEYFSAVIIGVFIALAAIAIFWNAVAGFLEPRAPRADATGFAVSIIATLINGGWAVMLLRVGRRVNSLSLRADGRHLMTDVGSTVAVIIGVLLAILTGVARLDAVFAGLVGIAILWSGWLLIRESVFGLMDVAVDPARLAQIREVIAANADGAIEAHDIRTRQAGPRMFIEFHLVVVGTMSVEAAHAICDRIEAQLRQTVGDAQITIHVEPESKAKHSGIVVI